MDNKKIAKELVKIAKEIKSYDKDLSDKMRKLIITHQPALYGEAKKLLKKNFNSTADIGVEQKLYKALEEAEKIDNELYEKDEEMRELFFEFEAFMKKMEIYH